jgi:hypothetical protein
MKLQFLFFSKKKSKSIFFESLTWVIIHMDFVSFPFRISKLKIDINYIKYKFSHKICRSLNMCYSKFRIIVFKNK